MSDARLESEEGTCGQWKPELVYLLAGDLRIKHDLRERLLENNKTIHGDLLVTSVVLVARAILKLGNQFSLLSYQN